jgi:hypothetical protein
MVTYDVDAVRRAVQFLVDAPYFNHHLKKIRSAVQKPRALPFKDEAECLNELVKVGRQNSQALENLIAVAQYKRDDKLDYQREFMATKRRRDKKVIEMEELLAGRRLSLDERKDVLHRQYEIWRREKDEFLSQKGDLPWAKKNEAIKDFWAIKELEVEHLIEEAKKAQANHARNKQQRKVVIPRPEPTTTLGMALKDATYGKK